jgi:hypothetical protein
LSGFGGPQPVKKMHQNNLNSDPCDLGKINIPVNKSKQNLNNGNSNSELTFLPHLQNGFQLLNNIA